MTKVYILSLGCPRNMVDSEVLMATLEKKGFILAENAEEADVAIVNTCGFIEDAKKEAIDYILKLAELKKEGKIKKLMVTGCLAQRYPKELVKEIKEIDAIFSSFDLENISGRKLLTPSHYAYVKIQEGCSNRCSYCVIPNIKGPRRSRAKESIIEEVERLKEQYGIKEVIIIGQDTTAFGAQLEDLLKEISKRMEHGWVRLLYTHPARFTDELIGTIGDLPNMCKYVDLPIQHASNAILERMNRQVTRLEMEKLISKIRHRIKNVTLRTSVIVGFPGETEEDFRELVSFLKETEFERLGAFLYSREEGTPAYNFKPQVAEKVKNERRDRLMLFQQKLSLAKNESLIGKKLDVLIDEEDTRNAGLFMARSEMDAPEVDGTVLVRGAKDTENILKPGAFVRVLITGAREYDLVGEAE